jgi:ATP phosphoribosyltransferase regulatory subunit
MTHSDPTVPTREAGPASSDAGTLRRAAEPCPQPSAAGAKAGGERLIALFARSGFARVEPPVLQPLEPFLDLSGEELRRRMFVTTDAEGRELCLRPEYTIPVSRLHLARKDAPSSAAYAYLGPVFRFRPGETGEFRQAGIEDFGREDREAADAEILDMALEALNELGASALATRIGDVGLFTALVAAMQLSGATARRLRRNYAAGKTDAPALHALAPQSAIANRHAGLLAALQGQDPAAARLFVEDILSIAGIATLGGRSANQIAARFLEQASSEPSGLSPEQIALFERFLAIEGHPDVVADRLRRFAAEAKLDMSAAIDRLEIRNGFMEARGIDLSSLSVATGFGRNLDYYTGFVFEITEARQGAKPLVGGGRYDGLLQRLGGAQEVPAVGCSIWLDRVVASAGAS